MEMEYNSLSIMKALDGEGTPIPQMAMVEIMNKQIEDNDDDFSLELINKMMDYTSEYRDWVFKQVQYNVRDCLFVFHAFTLYPMMQYEMSKKYPFKLGNLYLEDFESKLEPYLMNNLISTPAPRLKSVIHPAWELALKEGKNALKNNIGNWKIPAMICFTFSFLWNNTCKKFFRLRNVDAEAKSKKMTAAPTLDIANEEMFHDDAEDMWVYADKTKCVSVPNVYEGVLTAYSMYHVFNIPYDEHLKSLFTFFDSLAEIEKV